MAKKLQGKLLSELRDYIWEMVTLNLCQELIIRIIVIDDPVD